VFPGRPPVLFFDYEPECGAPARDSSRVLSDDDLEAEGFRSLPKMYFSHDKNQDVHEYKCVVNTFRHGSLYRTSISSKKWALYWGAHPTVEMLRSFHPFQKANHFPASWHLGRKDFLCRDVQKMKRQCPQQFNIAPIGFVLPEDFQAWVAAREQNPSYLWIWKPVSLSCGRGIRLFGSSIPPATDKKLSQKAGVVQRYIDNPLLINGFKFDLRLYVAVTSFDPLKVYLNAEGLVRLATERYEPSADNLDHRTMHLTNFSVNKHAETYAPNSEGLGAAAHRSKSATSLGEGGSTPQGEDGEESDGERGTAAAGDAVTGDGEGEDAEGADDGGDVGGEQQSSKWSLAQLREYFESLGWDYDHTMRRIEDVIIKTLLAAEPAIVNFCHQAANFSVMGSAPVQQLGPNQTCFEVYGFDIMLDDKLKPWLLEVNVFPSLASSSPFDKRVKTQLIADVLTMVGFLAYDHDLVDRAVKGEHMKRLQGVIPRTATVARSHTVQSLPSASLQDLGEAEWQLIMDTYDEYMRRGSFERIYPTREAAEKYAPLFAAPRYSNLVLARWLEAGGEHLFSPEASSRLGNAAPICFTAC